MPLYSNYAFRRLNICVSVFSFYETATDPIFPPLDLVEFSLQFGCGSKLKLRNDFVCVEIDAHEGGPEVKFAGLMLPYNSTPTRADQRPDFKAPEWRGEASAAAIRGAHQRAKAVVLQFEEPGWIVEGLQRSSELRGYNRREHTSIKRGWNDSVESREYRANPRTHPQNVRRRTPQIWSCRPGFIRSEEKPRPTESGLPSSIGRGQSGMAQKASCRSGSSQSQDAQLVGSTL